MTLPVCSWRSFCGPLALCSSPKVRGGDVGFDPAKICAPCTLADHPAIQEKPYVTTHYRPKPVGGPGTHLKALFLEHGLASDQVCNCDAMARRMNEWGPERCRRDKAELVTGILEGIAPAWREAAGMILEGLLDEAITRAAGQRTSSTSQG